MTVWQAQIDAADAAGAAVTLRFTTHNDIAATTLDGQTWWPAIVQLPTLRHDFFDGDFSGQIAAPTGEMIIRDLVGVAGARQDLAALRWASARCRLWRGSLGAAFGAYVLTFDGRITAQPQCDGGRLSLSLSVDDRWLDKPLLGTYLGTGGAEGPAAMAGQVKPLLFGAPRFCPATLIDADNLVWQLSGGAINAVEVAFDRLARFGASSGNHASLAALIAAVVPNGGWATCLALGLVRHGAPHDGQASWHVQGDSGGAGGWVRKPGAIIARIAALAGGAVSATSLTALDAARPWNISLSLTEQVTPRELIQQIAASVGAVAGVNWLGDLWCTALDIGTASLTLRSDGTTLPAVASVRAVPIGAPFWRLATKAEVTHVVHTLSEAAYDYVYRGAFDVARIYRLDDAVTTTDGSMWIWVGATPASGSTPAIGNANWTQQLDAVFSDAEGAKLTGIDVGATAGGNRIRNSLMSSTAEFYQVNSGAATRQTSVIAGDPSAFFRATATSLVQFVGPETGGRFAVRGGEVQHYSVLSRADVVNAAIGGANDRRFFFRQAYYTAAGAGIGTWDTFDTNKITAFGGAGGCGTGWSLHVCSYVAPTNAATVRLEAFPLLGSTGAGKFVDFAAAIYDVFQVGADVTRAALIRERVAFGATVGPNLLTNGGLALNSDGWWTGNSGGYATADIAWGSDASGGYLNYTGTVNRSTYANTRPDRTAPFTVISADGIGDGMPVIAGSTVCFSVQFASDGLKYFYMDAWFYNRAGTQVGYVPIVSGLSVNTAGVWTDSALWKITVPVGAELMFIRPTFGHSSGTYLRTRNYYASQVAPGATVNLVTSGATFPTSPVDGAVHTDTSVTPNVTKTRIGGVWVTAANLVTNTNQVTDGANLGGTAAWTGVSSRPAELTDGRILAGLNSTGDYLRDLPALTRITDRKLTQLQRADGVTAVTEAAVITSLGTAAAIAGQAATATSSDFASITGATKPANNATVGADLLTNVANKSLDNLDSTASTKLATIATGADVTASVTPSVSGNTLWNIAADSAGTITTALPETRVFEAYEGTTNRSPTTAFTLLAVSPSLSLTIDNTAASTTRGNVTMGTGTTGGGPFTIHAVLPGGAVVDTVVTVVKTNAAAPAGGSSGATYAQDTTFTTINSTTHATIGGELTVRSDASLHVRITVDLAYGVGFNKATTPKFKVSYATTAGGSLTDLFTEEAGSTAVGQTDLEDAIPGSYFRATATFTMPAANTDYFFKLLGRNFSGSTTFNTTFTGTAFTVQQ